VILKGKTQKGKNRIRELGSEWVLERTANTVLFDARPGPWGFVSPVSNPDNARWIHLQHDNDFDIAAIV